MENNTVSRNEVLQARQGKEKLVCYGIVLCGQNVERAVTLSFLTFHKKNYGNISLGKKLNLQGRTCTLK